MRVFNLLETDEVAQRLGQLSEKSAIVLNFASKETCSELSELADHLQYLSLIHI